MSLLLILGIWLSLSAVVSMVLGAVIAHGKLQSGGATTNGPAHPARLRSSAEYQPISTAEWSAAAQRVAMEALLSTGPVLVRRVPSRRPDPAAGSELPNDWL